MYSPDYLAQLDIIFAGGKSKEVNISKQELCQIMTSFQL